MPSSTICHCLCCRFRRYTLTPCSRVHTPTLLSCTCLISIPLALPAQACCCLCTRSCWLCALCATAAAVLHTQHAATLLYPDPAPCQLRARLPHLHQQHAEVVAVRQAGRPKRAARAAGPLQQLRVQVQRKVARAAQRQAVRGAVLEKVVLDGQAGAPGPLQAVGLQLEHKRLPRPVEARRHVPPLGRVAPKHKATRVLDQRDGGHWRAALPEQRGQRRAVHARAVRQAPGAQPLQRWDTRAQRLERVGRQDGRRLAHQPQRGVVRPVQVAGLGQLAELCLP
mmetsp:Transcript_22303/g.56744  ORF Transcript_22303/g.56744 Transcript_22303/m.56744 type:complete len:282 (+) Transcript_22303:170-1015(+)